MIDRGCGALLYDHLGREYLDLWAGGGVCSIGHSHPRYVEAICAQAEALSVGSFSSSVRSEYLALLASATPGRLNRVQFYSGGAEAVEAAVRFARSRTGRGGILTFAGAFHGKTAGALSMAGGPLRSQYGPPDGRTAVSMYPGTVISDDGAVTAAIIRARQVIEHDLAGHLAAIVVEPVQGTAGNVVPSDGFLAGLRELADEFGALLIFDEIITGFGRTGAMFAAQKVGVYPDAIIVGKGMGNGMPISGIIVDDDLADAPPFTDPSGSSSSYGGNPLSCAAGLATLQVLLEEQLINNVRDVGSQLRENLVRSVGDMPHVAAVRGVGLLIGVDLLDPASGSPLGPEHCARLFDLTLRAGLIVPAYASRVRINPPLCMTAEQADRAVAGFAQALKTLADDL